MSENRSGLAVGFTVFAATMMMIIGALHFIQGLVALFNDEFYVVGKKWTFSFDVTAWGWIHLILGIVVAVARGVLVAGCRVGPHRRRDRREHQRAVQLRLAALLPGVGLRHHRARCVRDLGSHRPRARYHCLTNSPSSSAADGGHCAVRSTCVPQRTSKFDDLGVERRVRAPDSRARACRPTG